MTSLLSGKKSAYRDSVILNSAAAIYISGKVDNLEMGINEATKSIDKGTALSKLNELIKFSEEIK